MPELPEVETIVRELNRAKPKVLGSTILDVWSDTKKIIKRPRNFQKFKKEILKRKISKIWRRGKNILFELDNKKTLLIHQKLTGHLLYGKWKRKKGEWVSLLKGPLAEDPMNKFLRVVFFLDNGWQISLSDLRKFAKIEILTEKELEKELSELGPEPLDRNFTFEKFKEAILKKKKGKIKKVLMDQKIIAGIGNIYSDEILWEAKLHPLKDISKISEEGLKKIYFAMREILKKAIQLKGESISDYRRISGERGYFDRERKVYRREGEKCLRCGTKIKKIKIGQRSAYFCPKCQKL